MTIQDWYRWRLRSIYRENRKFKHEINRLRQELRISNRAPRQTRTESALESITNVAIGLAVSVAANMLVLPLFGYSPNIEEAFEIGAIFTGISILRSYAVRRVFNRRT